MAPSARTVVAGSIDDVMAMPWKNGGGATRELHVEPPGADYADFFWRASIADVVRDGAFSRFDGIDRTIVLLAGDGFTMHDQGRPAHDLDTPFAPYRFAGEADISVSLHGSPCQDFNLMVRRDRAHAELQVLQGATPQALPAHTALLYVARGSVVVSLPAVPGQTGQVRQTLSRGQFLHLAQHAAPELHCHADAVLLAVCVRPR